MTTATIKDSEQEVRQRSTVACVVSVVMTLYPGEAATGTPDGVGFKRTPPRFLGSGDVVEVDLAGIVVKPIATQARV